LSTETFARAAAALLADLDLKVKRQVVGEDDKARVRYMQDNKGGHTTAKEPALDTWLRRQMATDFPLRQRLFHEWLKKADVPGVPSFEEFTEEDDSKGKKVRVVSSDTKSVTALKKLFKAWLDEADNRQVEIYAYMGPYEFPEKALAVIPEALPEVAEEPERSGVDEAQLEALRADYEKKLAKQAAELEKIKGLLEKAQEKRESDLGKAEEKWQREKEQLQSKLAETSGSAKKLQEEVSAKSQPISQLKRDLEDALRQNERLTKELAEARTTSDNALKQRDEAVSKRTALEADLDAAKKAEAEIRAKFTEAERKASSSEGELKYFHEAKAWMLVDPETLEELKENMEVELDIRSEFSKILQLDLAKKGSFQQRATDLHEVWKKLVAQETEVIEEFFGVALQEVLKDGDKLRDAASGLQDLKDSLLAREMAALALNHICNRFLEKKKAPPTPAKA
jgi:DNA repair exonuclease SbcCD ATPase subunit